jgi:hypothetical protein
MPWVMSFVALAFAGLVVLAFCAARLYLAVRGLGRELARTGRRLEPRRTALKTAALALERSRE